MTGMMMLVLADVAAGAVFALVPLRTPAAEEHVQRLHWHNVFGKPQILRALLY